MSQSQTEIEAQLTLRDRLNYPYILADAILTLHKAVLNIEFSEREIIEAIKNLWTSLPTSWEDEQFKKDLKEARMDETIDIRPEFCGIKASEEFCKQHAIPISKINQTYDYGKLKRACIDLMDRRGMMTKKIYTEIMTGRPYEGEDAEDLANTETSEF